jgi:hypothetical protein
MIDMVRRFTLIPYTFVLMNWAAVAGLYYFIKGSAGIWNSVRPRSSSGIWSSAEVRN